MAAMNLSDLPEDIIHHIFSCLVLTNKEAVQLSLLSKQLSPVLQKRPTLVFDYRKIDPPGREPDDKYTVRHREELNYIVSTLDRYCRENIPLESFTLMPDYWMVTKEDTYDRCIELATKKSLRKLMIWIDHEKENDVSAYILPQAVFQVESLVELELWDCYLEPERKVVWPNLKRLEIWRSSVANEEGFEYITGGCPSIENMGIDCRRFSSSVFKFANLRNLKQLDIRLRINQCLEMSASTTPNLESISCSSGHVDLGNTEYPNLTDLTLFDCGGMDDHFFNNFARKFPKLGNLCLGCEQIQRINLSSPSLKEISLWCTDTLQEACFNLPNLVNFTYFTYNEGNKGIEWFPKLSFAGDSSGWSSRITLTMDKSEIDAFWFLELNEFLAALNKSETSIHFCIDGEEEELFNDEEHLIIANPVIPVQGIKEFSMSTSTDWSGFSSAILDCILLICQPQTITFEHCEDYEIPELLYKKLISTNSLDRRGVVDFEMSCLIDRETSQRSTRFKDWDKFQEVLKDDEDISFHLEYCSENVPSSD